MQEGATIVATETSGTWTHHDPDQFFNSASNAREFQKRCFLQIIVLCTRYPVIFGIYSQNVL